MPCLVQDFETTHSRISILCRQALKDASVYPADAQTDGMRSELHG